MFETERFVEREVIGQGSSGVVIRAFDKEILRDVAIKIFGAEPANDSPATHRFIEEAQITGQLEHPNIVPVYELSLDPRGRRFLAMKLIQGATLAQTLSRLGSARLEPGQLGELLLVFVKVCDAVSFAHSRGVIHRDLKPSNIMVSDFGQVYVLDWGVASLRPRQASGDAFPGSPVRVDPNPAQPTEPDPPGALIGTVGYMAPEQLRGLHEKIDERTDVFGLGATLYQILTGEPPLNREILKAIWMGQTPPPLMAPDRVVPGARVPPELSRIALRATSYNPVDRYPSVEALKSEIGSFHRGAWDRPRKTFPAGSTILTEGEPGDTAYVILEGQCLVYRIDDGEEIALRRMGPGEVFGETAVFSAKPRTASVRAVTDVVLIEVTHDVIARGLGLNSWMGAFVKALAERFRDVDERLRQHERAGRPAPSRP